MGSQWEKVVVLPMGMLPEWGITPDYFFAHRKLLGSKFSLMAKVSIKSGFIEICVYRGSSAQKP